MNFRGFKSFASRIVPSASESLQLRSSPVELGTEQACRGLLGVHSQPWHLRYRFSYCRDARQVRGACGPAGLEMSQPQEAAAQRRAAPEERNRQKSHLIIPMLTMLPTRYSGWVTHLALKDPAAYSTRHGNPKSQR